MCRGKVSEQGLERDREAETVVLTVIQLGTVIVIQRPAKSTNNTVSAQAGRRSATQQRQTTGGGETRSTVQNPSLSNGACLVVSYPVVFSRLVSSRGLLCDGSANTHAELTSERVMNLSKVTTNSMSANFLTRDEDSLGLEGIGSELLSVRLSVHLSVRRHGKRRRNDEQRRQIQKEKQNQARRKLPKRRRKRLDRDHEPKTARGRRNGIATHTCTIRRT